MYTKLFYLETVSNILDSEIGTVGKTSIFTRLVTNEYKEISVKTRTKDACNANKAVKINESIIMTNLCDTAGEEKYRALAPLYYRDCDAALLIFDMTKKESFDRVEKWISELQNRCSNIKISICGNKSDLIDDFQISENQIKDMAIKQDATYFIISAKTGENVEECYMDLIRRIHSNKNGSRRTSVNLKVNYSKDSKVKEEKKNCC